MDINSVGTALNRAIRILESGEHVVEQIRKVYRLVSMIKPTTGTDKIIKRAIMKASAGYTVVLGPHDEWVFWYDDRSSLPHPQWAVKLPDASYPVHFDGTDEAATFFVKSWIKENRQRVPGM